MHEDIRVSYFHLALIELLKRRGFYTLHATALEKTARGFSFQVVAGVAKLQPVVSLLRSGYRCLSDDHPLLHENNGELELLAFEEKVDITENSLKFFPEFQGAGTDKLPEGFGSDISTLKISTKMALPCVAASYVAVSSDCDTPTSCVEPLKKSRALEELLPETMAVFDKKVAKAGI